MHLKLGPITQMLNQFRRYRGFAVGIIVCTAFLLGSAIAAASEDAAKEDVANEANGDAVAGSSQEADRVRTIYRRSDHAIADAPEDLANRLERAEQRRAQRDSLIPFTLFEPVRSGFQQATKSLYEKTSIKVGVNKNFLFQAISDGFPNTDREGVGSDMDVIATWEAVNKGAPNQGQVFLHMEGRWDYGTTPPSTLGDRSLGTIIRTADPFNSYTPTFLARNFYWQQGSRPAGWIYRIGKITSDQIIGTSFHLNPFVTFLPSGSVGSNAAFPDSGLGAVGIVYPNERSYVLGLIGDANGDREEYGFGDIGEGDFFKAVEFGYKILPQTDRAGFSKLSIGHTDGTADGRPNNVSLGPSGWSIAAKYEQELTTDGRVIGILKYGRTFDDSGLFKHLASGHIVLYDPDLPGVRAIKNDVLGVGLTWGESYLPDTRDETNIEVFYRFPLFTDLDLTLSYQSFFNVARNPDVDHAHAFGIRLRTTF